MKTLEGGILSGMALIVARVGGLLLVGCCVAGACGQDVVALSPVLARSAGVEGTSGIAYTRLYLTSEGEARPESFDLARATLTVQCTQGRGGRLGFEMFVNDGGVTDAAFYPPWRRTNDTELFAPATEKVMVTMEFLGYTKVKPVKRQFEWVTLPVGQMRYNSPSGGSRNLEEIAFYFQYLKALPLLRVSYPGHTMTFATEGLLARIRMEVLCRGSGL